MKVIGKTIIVSVRKSVIWSIGFYFNEASSMYVRTFTLFLFIHPILPFFSLLALLSLFLSLFPKMCENILYVKYITFQISPKSSPFVFLLDQALIDIRVTESN